MKIRTKLAAGLLAGAMALSSFSGMTALAATPDTTKTVTMQDLIAPALQKNTDAAGVAKLLSTALRYSAITTEEIWQLKQEGYQIPADSFRILYEGGWIPAYYYKVAAGLAVTREDVADVFDPAYYAEHNELIQNALASGAITNDPETLFLHFMLYGMQSGLQGSANFSLETFKANYPKIVEEIGDNNAAYYSYFLMYGKEKGLVADHLLKTK